MRWCCSKPIVTEQEFRDALGAELSHQDGASNHEAETVESIISQEAQAADVSDNQLSSKLKIAFEDVVFHQSIGKGSFKSVYRGRWGNTNVAIVRMRQGGMVTEARVLQKLSVHPNLVQFYRWTTDLNGNEYMVMEFVKLGSLDKILIQYGDLLRTRAKLCMCEQICSAMCELAGEGVLHCDLAARNILMQSIDPVHVKVSDFGLAHTPSIKSPEAKYAVPIRWSPPEVLKQGPCSEKSDVWSFGVVMWEIFSQGAEPFTDKTDEQVVQYVLAGSRLKRPSRCPNEIYELMLSCWAAEADLRPSFAQIAKTFKHWRTVYLHKSSSGDSRDMSGSTSVSMHSQEAKTPIKTGNTACAETEERVNQTTANPTPRSGLSSVAVANPVDASCPFASQLLTRRTPLVSHSLALAMEEGMEGAAADNSTNLSFDVEPEIEPTSSFQAHSSCNFSNKMSPLNSRTVEEGQHVSAATRAPAVILPPCSTNLSCKRSPYANIRSIIANTDAHIAPMPTICHNPYANIRSLIANAPQPGVVAAFQAQETAPIV